MHTSTQVSNCPCPAVSALRTWGQNLGHGWGLQITMYGEKDVWAWGNGDRKFPRRYLSLSSHIKLVTYTICITHMLYMCYGCNHIPNIPGNSTTIRIVHVHVHVSQALLVSLVFEYKMYVRNTYAKSWNYSEFRIHTPNKFQVESKREIMVSRGISDSSRACCIPKITNLWHWVPYDSQKQQISLPKCPSHPLQRS